jgi:hypothetical protein
MAGDAYGWEKDLENFRALSCLLFSPSFCIQPKPTVSRIMRRFETLGLRKG